MKHLPFLVFIGFLISSCNVESGGESGEMSETTIKRITEEKEEIKEDLTILKKKIREKNEVLEERKVGTSGQVRSDLEALESKMDINRRRIELAIEEVENATGREWSEVRKESQKLADEVQEEIKGIDFGLK